MKKLIPSCIRTAALATALLTSTSAGRAADLVWTNASGGNWNVAVNWSPNQVPAAGDNLFITNSGTYTVTVNASATVNTLVLGADAGTQTLAITGGTLSLTNTASVGAKGVLALSGGTLTGGGNVTVDGRFNWTGGNLDGSGLLQVNGGMTLSGTGQYFQGRTLVNTATATVSGSTLYVGGSGVLSNALGATFDLTANVSFQSVGAFKTHNVGLFRKTGGTGTSILEGPFHNTGTVEVQTGALRFGSPGGGTHSGSFAVNSGATLEFAGGTHALVESCQVNGAGTARVNGATVNLAGTWNLTGPVTVSAGSLNPNNPGGVTLGGLTLSGGTFAGTGPVTVAGPLDWTGGNLDGSGLLQVNGGMTLSGTGQYFQGRTLVNTATATMSGTTLYAGGSGVLSNAVGATFDLTANVSFQWVGGAFKTHNLGLFRKTGGTGTSILEGPFHNTGTVEVQTGALRFGSPGGGTHSGSFAVNSGATLEFAGGTHALVESCQVNGGGTARVNGATVNLAGAWNLTGPVLVSAGSLNPDNPGGVTLGGLTLSGGTLAGTGPVTVAGPLNWSGGNLNGSGLLQVNGGMTLSGTGQYFQGRTLVNTAAATLSGTTLYVGGIGVLSNALGATFDLTANVSFQWVGGAFKTHNLGLFRKTGGTGTSILESPFHNTGTVEVRTGTLSFSGAFTQTAGATLLHGGRIANSSPLQILGGRLAGTNSISGGVVNGAAVSPGASPGQLTIQGAFTQNPGGALTIELGGTNAATEFDVLSVGGTASLGGVLEVRLVNGYVPPVGTTFRVLNAGTRSQTFHAFVYPSDQVALRVDYLSNAVDIKAVSQDCAPLPLGAVGWWQGEYDALDSVSTNHGNLVNGASFAAGNVGAAFSFDGVNDEASLPERGFAAITNNFTAELWVHPTAGRGIIPETVSSQTGIGTGQRYAVFPAHGDNVYGPGHAGAGLSIGTNGVAVIEHAAFFIPSPLVFDGPIQGWTHLALVYSNGTPALYLNGTLARTGLKSPRVVHPSALLGGGAYGHYAGLLDEYTLYSRALGSDEIAALAAAGEAGKCVAPEFLPLVVAPASTNAIVGQSTTFTVSGGLQPYSFALATNQSGGSINAFSGVYVAGPLADVTDVVRVRDALGSNVLATVSVLPDPTPRPDLAVHAMLAPPAATSSVPVELIWIVTNRGTASASAPWTERLFLSGDAEAGDDRFLAAFVNDTALAAGGFLTRTQTVLLPADSPAGTTRFVVQVDAEGQVNESSEGNNLVVAAEATAIAPQLFLTPASSSIAEGASFAFTVTRNGVRAAALTVSLNSSDPGELAAPASVTIPAGAATFGFSASGVADGAFDGAQVATLTASALGFVEASAAVLVLDRDVPHLTLTLATNRLSEGASLLATVTRELVSATPLVVEVSSVGGQVAFPTLVTIPAETNAMTFAVVAVGDTAVERTTTVTLRVAAADYLPVTAELLVEDDDLPGVVITLANATVGEGAGANATMGLVTRDRNSPRALVIPLASDNPNAALVPASVTIPAGQTQASFPIGVVDDSVVDGSQLAVISGLILATGSALPVGAAVPATLTVTDDDGPALRLRLARELVGEGLSPATTGTVSRNNGTSGALVVTLASSDASEATVPGSVVIPDGAEAVDFAITSLNDGVPDGNQSVSLSATAPGFAPAAAPLVVSDTDLPDLVFSRLVAPTNGVTGALVDVAFRLENQGLASAGTNCTQRVLLSTDAQAGEDTVLSQVAFSGTIPIGLFFEQTVRVRLPQTPGTYWIVVAADVNNQIAEGLENNNTRVTVLSIVVEKAYAATVIADVQTAPAGTPVLLHGHASRTGGGAAAFELVNVHLSVRGTKRVLTALTDAGGNYAITFQPLPGEAGIYAVGADHPGVADPPPQATFALLGLRVDPPATMRVIAGLSATNTLVVQNLGNVPLAGLTAVEITGPTNLTLALSFANPAVAADSTTELQAIVTAPPGLAGSSAFRVRLASAEGATGEFDLPVTVESLQPRLIATPGSLAAGMRRGELTTVQFAVTNQGGAISGPISVWLPPLPWMGVSGGAEGPPLAPGEGMLVTLTLTPAGDLPLGDHSGSLVVSGGNSSVGVPFSLRALSDDTGALRVSAVDELTFYAEGAPVLTNASIRLSDPASGATVLATNLAGRVELVLADLPEAFYTLRLEAPNHASYQETFLLQPARTNEVVAFLSRQTVRYTWTVEPVLIEDRYEITVETTFETSVPLPVITVEPQVIDLSKFPGETKQVEVTIRNHGLLAAQNMRLNFDSHPSVVATPLINVIGELAAQSALTIPVTFRRASGGGGGLRTLQAASSGGGSCQLGGKIEWTIDCAGQQITHVVPLAAINLSQFGVQCGTSAQFFAPAGGPPGGVNFAGGGGIGNPGYTAPIAMAEKSVCDPCFQKIGGGLLQNCLPLLPLPLFDDEVGPQEPCESGAGTAQQFIACMQDALDDVTDVVSEPLEALGELGEDMGGDFGEGLSDGANAISDGLEAVGDILGKLNCLSPLLDPCAFGGGSGSGSGAGGAGGRLAAASVSVAPPITAPLTNRILQALGYVGRHTNLFGSDLWFRGTNLHTLTNWLGAFRERIANGSENGPRVSAGEGAQLLALPVPTPVTVGEATRFLERWNRTVDYYIAGMFSRTNVPPGQSLDFIAWDERLEVLAASRAAHSNAVAQGFRDVAHAFNFTRQEMLNLIFAQTGGTCARVRLRLEQEAVISRDAFQARLEIENTTASPLDALGVTLLITDESGADRTEWFQIRPPTLDGLSGVDGAGLLPAQSTGSAAWFLVPTASAAPTNRTRYFVSGSLTYGQDGTRLTLPLAPAAIDVLPTPRLFVDYFHERDVFSDDPFTPEVEPAIPYSLAVRVRNQGFGAAKDFRITSAQPQIVDNDKGLFIHFEIIATEVGGVGLAPALTADFGDIAPGASVVGRWLFRSSLQGLFTSYDARFEHISGLGDRRLSLIDSVNIHEMIHLVQADRAFEDGLPDFLVNDVPDLRDLPDTLHLSTGSSAPVNVATNGMVDGPITAGHLAAQLSLNPAPGWVYVRVADPADQTFRLREVRRADQSLLRLGTNVWRTDRTFIGFGQRPLRENVLHLLDNNSAGAYTLVYESTGPTPDTNAPSSAVTALPAASPASFNVTWSGSDGANGSGLVFFDVFVSVDGGPFTQWLARATGGGAVFNGEPNRIYAFFSRATDAAGNTEAPPVMPDAQTSTTVVNTAPQLSLGADQSIDEGTTLFLTASVTDPDAPPQSFTFALLPGAPPGVSLNSSSGTLSFPTSEGTGPSTNLISVRVTDNGVPPLAATSSVAVIVREVNSPPTLAPLPDRIINEGSNLVVTATATDPDLPANALVFALGPNAPAGAALTAGGVFSWRPHATQGPSSNRFNLIVTDNSIPPLSATQAFTVIVRDHQADFTVAVGWTNLFAGESNTVPVLLSAGVELNELSFQLATLGGQLDSLALGSLAPQVTSASIEALAPDRSRLRFLMTGLLTASNHPLAALSFQTAPEAPSEIVRLAPFAASAIDYQGTNLAHAAFHAGLVVIVNREPVLLASEPSHPRLTLFGHPGTNYVLEAATNLPAHVTWQPFQSLRLTEPSASFEVSPSGPTLFFRAVEMQTP